jgi:hypothetical protein
MHADVLNPRGPNVALVRAQAMCGNVYPMIADVLHSPFLSTSGQPCGCMARLSSHPLSDIVLQSCHKTWPNV